jgi:PTS system nitrogen regulatory IIA component
MQMTVRDVSEALTVSESTVARWIKHRGLPARHVAGQYRFNRAELLEWATANGVKVSVDLFARFEDDDEPVPGLADALERGGIFYRLPDTNRDRALRSLVEALPLPAGMDRELLLRLFLAREASASTGIGDGIAIPHVRNPIVLNVADPMVTLCFLEKAVDFGALDGKPVQVLFSVISPTIRGHLQLLSRLSFALHDRKFRGAVRAIAARDVILAEARRVDSAMTAAPAGGGKAAG